MVLFYSLIFAMPLVRHSLWGTFVGDLTLVKYLGVICMLYALLYLPSRNAPLRFIETRQARWFLSLVSLAFISWLIKARSTPWEISPFMSYLSFLFLFFTTLVLVDSLQRLRWVVLAAIGSLGYASLHALREWQKYGGLAWGYRPGWISGDPNYFTVSALLCLPLMFYLVGRKEQPPWEKWVSISCLVLTGFTVILAASRGGFAGLVAAILFMVWRSRQRARNLVWAGALLIPLVLAAPVSPVQRLLHPRHDDVESEERRLELWKAGLRMVVENPLTGVGLGNFKPLVTEFADSEAFEGGVAHNSYVEIAAEMGLPGLVAFVAVLWSALGSLQNVAQQSVESEPLLLQRVAQGLQAGLLGAAVAIFFVSAQYQKLFWLTIFLSTCLPSIVSGPTTSEGAFRTRNPGYPGQLRG